MMLALLLARAGVDVTVMEKHPDFLRDFRGDPDWEKNAASTIEMATAIAQKINPEFKGAKLEAAKEKVHKMCAWDEKSLIGFAD